MNVRAAVRDGRVDRPHNGIACRRAVKFVIENADLYIWRQQHIERQQIDVHSHFSGLYPCSQNHSGVQGISPQ